MEAAQKEVQKLHEQFTKNGINLFGKISVLSPVGDKYEPIQELTQFINRPTAQYNKDEDKKL